MGPDRFETTDEFLYNGLFRDEGLASMLHAQQTIRKYWLRRFRYITTKSLYEEIDFLRKQTRPSFMCYFLNRVARLCKSKKVFTEEQAKSLLSFFRKTEWSASFETLRLGITLDRLRKFYQVSEHIADQCSLVIQLMHWCSEKEKTSSLLAHFKILELRKQIDSDMLANLDRNVKFDHSSLLLCNKNLHAAHDVYVTNGLTESEYFVQKRLESEHKCVKELLCTIGKDLTKLPNLIHAVTVAVQPLVSAEVLDKLHGLELKEDAAQRFLDLIKGEPLLQPCKDLIKEAECMLRRVDSFSAFCNVVQFILCDIISTALVKKSAEKINAVSCLILTHGVEYEKEKFTRMFSEYGDVLPKTRDWVVSCIADNLTSFRKAYLSLIASNEEVPYLETLVADYMYLKDLQSEFKYLVFAGSLLWTLDCLHVDTKAMVSVSSFLANNKQLLPRHRIDHFRDAVPKCGDVVIGRKQVELSSMKLRTKVFDYSEDDEATMDVISHFLIPYYSPEHLQKILSLLKHNVQADSRVAVAAHKKMLSIFRAILEGNDIPNSHPTNAALHYLLPRVKFAARFFTRLCRFNYAVHEIRYKPLSF